MYRENGGAKAPVPSSSRTNLACVVVCRRRRSGDASAARMRSDLLLTRLPSDVLGSAAPVFALVALCALNFFGNRALDADSP
jgi:hypothetical protein